ncbi:hypothetical protein PN462_13750 [Spirulina sp. CS-785/01]|uniref:hypothetical protein n=1 Tax=Spirulina sp. CS-785/01 TaxID=3021716 RepID=UPI00232F68E3|nr:hypothetical protein [Spirulina sp. CS-785/01]MDB9314171.1 hypothetical protein [Spirulina sp. CS-785/01]
MAAYSESEMKDAMIKMIREDAEVQEELRKAVGMKKRSRIAQIVGKAASLLGGSVAQEVIERLVDWFIQKGMDLF